MYSVSLLPYEYRMLHQNARKKDVSLLIAVVAMAVAMAVYLFLSISAASKDRELEDIQAQQQSVSRQITRLQDLEGLNSKASSLLSQAMLAAGSNPTWSNLIAALGNSVPQSVGLTNISMKYAGIGGECILQGTAVSHQAVSEWMKELSALKGIGEIKCSFSSEDESNANNQVQFELRFPLLPGPGYKLPAEVLKP
ncbi:MAG: PilN domain-containing protein [Clostridia bacterium]|nr:PilN domain-containing protein [Clostridia bacterium]